MVLDEVAAAKNQDMGHLSSSEPEMNHEKSHSRFMDMLDIENQTLKGTTSQTRKSRTQSRSHTQ